MISFAELLTRLVHVVQLTPRDVEYDCPRCDGRATVRSFGRGWSAKCEGCGEPGKPRTLTEDDFRDADAPTEGQGVERTLVGNSGPLHARQDVIADVAQGKERPVSTGKVAGSNPAIRASSAAQPAQEEVDANASRTRRSITATASVGEADAHAGIQASEEVMRREGQLWPTRDNAAPAAGVNGAGGGRSYQPNFTHRDTTAEDYGAQPQPERPKASPRTGKPPSRGIPAADDILKRVPPQNLQAEQAVFASIFIDNETLNVALKSITTESFYREAHREVFNGMVALHDRGVPIEMVTLTQELRTRGVFESIGGGDYLAELAIAESTARNMEHYAGIVRDMAIKRQIASQATLLASLAYDGVTVPALVGEVERILKPLSVQIGAATVFPEPLTASQWYARETELFSRVTWIWDNILEGGGISVLAGKKGAGKSTFVRTLMLAAARGWALLDRNMQQSRIWYIDMEPGGSARKALMEQLGWNDDDQLHISTGSPMAGKPGLFEWLKGKIIANRYQMVVVDTMYKLLKIEGTNDYDKGIYGQVPIEEICRETGCHFMLIHHARKNPSPGALSSIAEEILGSVSVAATAGTVMLIRKRADVGTFQMDPPRYGEAIEGEIVLKKLGNGWVEGAGSYGNQWVGWAKQAVLAAISERGADWSKAEDIEVIDVAKGGPMTVKSKKWLLGKLVDEKTVERSGEGVRGDPYRYRRASLMVPEPDPRYKDS